MVQTAIGFNIAEGEAYVEYEGKSLPDHKAAPRPLPMQALDHAAGYLLAFGVNAALCRTITVSLDIPFELKFSVLANSDFEICRKVDHGKYEYH